MQTQQRPPAAVLGELAASVASRLSVLDFLDGWREAVTPPPPEPEPLPAWMKLVGLAGLGGAISKILKIGGEPLSLPMLLEAIQRLTTPPTNDDAPESPADGPSLRVVPSPEDELPSLVLRVQRWKGGLRVQYFGEQGWGDVAEGATPKAVMSAAVPMVETFASESPEAS